jgi:hypothetical protein
MPQFDPDSTDAFQVDLRCYDLSKLDLTHSLDDLLCATFDNRTVWADLSHLPRDFDPNQIMEIGKNPGLGIRALHERGITGRGVGIAILDQPLLVHHEEYADRLRLYEEINIKNGTTAQMHGPAVASIAVGKTVGVAPGADLYYIAEWNGDWKNGKFTWDFKYLAQGVRRILEISKQLPKDKKIRVISISVGWHPSQRGYKEITDAVQEAKGAGMLVICSSTDQVHGFGFHGLGRPPLANPDDFNSHEPGLWWAKMFYQGNLFHSGPNRLLVPMDSRTTASPTGPGDCVFYRHAGWSWAIPYIAGAYALAAQVEPNITPDRFWALAMRTGRTIKLDNSGTMIPFGPILQPVKLIDALKAGELADRNAVAAELAKYKLSIPTVVDSAFQKDVNAKLNQLNIGKTTRAELIDLFGKPLSYRYGMQTFEETNLPERYTMAYPDGFSVFMIGNHIRNLHFKTPGYFFHEKIQVGSSVEEVFEVLGQPKETIEGQEKSKISRYDVLYKDIDGRKGHCFYESRKHGVAMWFVNDNVHELIIDRAQPPQGKD